MDLEDLFNRDHHRRKREHHNYEKKHGHYGDRIGKNDHESYDKDHDDDDRWSKNGDHKYRHHNDLLNISTLMPHLVANKKLLISAGIVLLAVIVLAGIILLPLLGQVIGYMDTIGVKGAVERVWQGSGGGR
ncbi:MAG: hypothetical protein KJ826_10295 [Proteobacteria bacterium]|nr:hypothetical protein [Pseudomonadota bacterium]